MDTHNKGLIDHNYSKELPIYNNESERTLINKNTWYKLGSQRQR